MTEKPAVYEVSQKVEQVVLAGDLSQLGPSERVNYYKAVCDSLGLNPLTRPFEFLKLQGRLILYPRAALADQLRRLHQVSIDNIERITNKNLYTVIVRGHTADGRTDEASASVDISKLGNSLLANACMKCETKAKRRFTLSIIGLGWLESVSVDAIDEGRQLPAYSDADLAEVRDVTAEVLSEQDSEDITDGEPTPKAAPEPQKNGEGHWLDDKRKRGHFWAKIGELGLDEDALKELTGVESIHNWSGTANELYQLAKTLQDAQRGQ